MTTATGSRRATNRLAAASRAWIAAAEDAAMERSTAVPIDRYWAGYRIGRLLDDNCIVFDETLPPNRTRDYFDRGVPGSYFANPGSSGGWATGAALGGEARRARARRHRRQRRRFLHVRDAGPGVVGGRPSRCAFPADRPTPTAATPPVPSASRPTTAPTATPPRPVSRAVTSIRRSTSAKEAEAAGAHGETVRDPAALEGALARGLEQVRDGKPALVSIWLKRLEGED